MFIMFSTNTKSQYYYNINKHNFFQITFFGADPIANEIFILGKLKDQSQVYHTICSLLFFPRIENKILQIYSMDYVSNQVKQHKNNIWHFKTQITDKVAIVIIRN